MNFKTTTYWSIYEKIFQFHKKFCSAKSESEWEVAITEAGTLCKSYQGKPEHIFVKDLLVAIIDEIERASKGGNC